MTDTMSIMKILERHRKSRNETMLDIISRAKGHHLVCGLSEDPDYASLDELMLLSSFYEPDKQKQMKLLCELAKALEVPMLDPTKDMPPMWEFVILWKHDSEFPLLARLAMDGDGKKVVWDTAYGDFAVSPLTRWTPMPGRMPQFFKCDDVVTIGYSQVWVRGDLCYATSDGRCLISNREVYDWASMNMTSNSQPRDGVVEKIHVDAWMTAYAERVAAEKEKMKEAVGWWQKEKMKEAVGWWQNGERVYTTPDGKFVSHKELVSWCAENMGGPFAPHDGVVRVLHIEAWMNAHSNKNREK